MTPEDYLKRPYHWVFVPLDEDGCVFGRIEEFPGCLTDADTMEEAVQSLRDAALSWVESCLELGQDIPEPRADFD